jgi:hypothetical protein
MGLIAVAVTLAVLVTPAAAQIGNPAGVDPATPQSAPGDPAPHHANTQDKTFSQLAAAGGLTEVELGKRDVADCYRSPGDGQEPRRGVDSTPNTDRNDDRRGNP